MNEELQTTAQLNLDRAKLIFIERQPLIDSQTGKLSGIEPVDESQFQGKRKIWLDRSRPFPEEVIPATLTLADFRHGKSFIDIQHTVDPVERHKSYYSTSITNRSAEKLRIDLFGTYTLNAEMLVLHTMTGGFSGTKQFQEWYDLGESEWIEPGQVVTDRNNHSKVGVYWTYFGTTASGQQFVAGELWSGKHWWRVW